MFAPPICRRRWRTTLFRSVSSGRRRRLRSEHRSERGEHQIHSAMRERPHKTRSRLGVPAHDSSFSTARGAELVQNPRAADQDPARPDGTLHFVGVSRRAPRARSNLRAGWVTTA